MTDRILIQLLDGKWLALSPETFQQALLQGNELIPMGGSTEQRTQDDDRPIWFSVPDVARLCNISETFLRNEISLKRIRARYFGRAVRIHRDFVEHQTGDLMSNGNNEE